MMGRILPSQCRWLLPALLLAMPVAYADDDNDMLAAEPDATEETLKLPDEAAQEGHDNAAYGLKQANEAREMRRDYGERRADQDGGNRGSGRRD